MNTSLGTVIHTEKIFIDQPEEFFPILAVLHGQVLSLSESAANLPMLCDSDGYESTASRSCTMRKNASERKDSV